VALPQAFAMASPLHFQIIYRNNMAALSDPPPDPFALNHQDKVNCVQRKVLLEKLSVKMPLNLIIKLCRLFHAKT
jgi:hypothetical protein